MSEILIIDDIATPVPEETLKKLDEWFDVDLLNGHHVTVLPGGIFHKNIFGTEANNE